MKARCPHCGNTWSVSKKYSGVVIRCTRCQEPVIMRQGGLFVRYLLVCLVSAAFAAVVSYGILSTRPDPGQMSTVSAEIQAKIDTAAEALEKINAEIERLQGELDYTASQPMIAKADKYSLAEILPEIEAQILPETKDPNSIEESQNETGQDDPKSLFVFEGNITRHIGPQLLLVSSRRQTSEFTYSNYKYVPPFVIDGTAVIELAEKHPLLQKPDGSKIELYVVQDGKYEYKEAIGAIEIAKEVNKYRETNLKDPPKQELVEFQGQQKVPGARSRPAPQPRRPARRPRTSQRPPPQ